MKKIAAAFVLPVMLVLGACTDNIGADHYNTSAAGQVNRAVKGTIIAVRPVVVSDGDGNSENWPGLRQAVWPVP